jgi:MFS family permease
LLRAALRAIQDEAGSKLPALEYTVPYAVGNILLNEWARGSRQSCSPVHDGCSGPERYRGMIAAWVAAAGLAISQLPCISATVVVIGFCIAMMGIMSYYPCYWALPTKLLNARIAAAVCGLITMANIGGFVGPYAIGFLIDLTGTQVAGVLVLVMSTVLAGGSVAVRRTR